MSLPLTYDYAWELEQDAPRALAEGQAFDAKRNSLEAAGKRLDEAARLLMRQAVREPIVPTAYARAQRRYAAACDDYTRALGERRAKLDAAHIALKAALIASVKVAA